MNDLYGVDPKAPSNLNELVSLIRLFAPSEGRFIADYPLGWTSEMIEHMSSISDLCRMATVEAIIRLGAHNILPLNKQYKQGLSWSENAFFIREDVVKLIGPSDQSKKLVEPLNQVLLDPNSFRDSRAGLIPRTAYAYASVATPILLRSPKVVLVDPFFSLRDSPSSYRLRNVVKTMLKIAQQGKYVECFEIHYVQEKNVAGAEFLQNDLKELANEIGFMSLQVSARPIRKVIKTDQHARYLLGLKSGLHFDHGFDTNTDGSTNHIQWMSPAVLDPLLEKFMVLSL